MFGIGFSELIIILVIAIVFLGPDKLPEAMVKVARLFKTLKKGLDDVKKDLEDEVGIQDLKKSVSGYKGELEKQTKEINKNANVSVFDDVKETAKSISSTLKEIEFEIKKDTKSKK